MALINRIEEKNNIDHARFPPCPQPLAGLPDRFHESLFKKF